MPPPVAPRIPVELAPAVADARPELVIRPPSWSFVRVFRGIPAIARHGDLLYAFTVHRIRVRYKQSALGLAWAVIQPLATMAVMAAVFSYIARVETGAVPYAVFALAGLVPWTCFSNAITSGTQSLVGHAALVTRVYFPREILPLTYVFAAALDCAIAGGLLLLMMAVYGLAPASSAWMAAPVLLVLMVLVTGLVLAAAATHVQFRDVGVALPIVLQLLLFASPIAYPLDLVPAGLASLYVLNPLTGIVENFRRAMLGTAPLHLESLMVSAAWAAAVLPLAYAYFKRVEATAADVI